MTEIIAIANSLIPVITIDDAADAQPLANVLADNGFSVLEITLRTPAGLPAIERLAKSHPQITLGAGTVLTAQQAEACRDAGAEFLVSPGFCPTVHEYCLPLDMPYLPGVATVTEAITAYQLGYQHLKLFPANTVGGTKMLSALHSVLPDLSFCPTGGVNATNLADFLSQPNVTCVGGSWLTSIAMMQLKRWTDISTLAASATATIARRKS